MQLIEAYPIATVCQVLDYPRSQVFTRTFESVGHGLEKGGQWIASRPDALKETIETLATAGHCVDAS